MSLFDLPRTASKPPKAPKKPMPDWLKRHLENTGAMDSTKAGPPATRKAHTIFCPHCHVPVIRGLLPAPAAWALDADPAPLTPEGQLLALLANLKLYELHFMYDHYEFVRRDEYRIRGNPAGPQQGFDILTEHRCHIPTDTKLRAESQVPDERVVNKPLPEEPPF